MNIFFIIIAIPTFFILRWLFKKYIRNHQHRTIATWVGTVVLTPQIYLVAVFIFFLILFHEPTRKFDKASWNSDRTHRFQMADNIIKSKLLIGKDTAQIKKILGDTPLKYDDSTQQIVWTYDMGEGGGGLGFLFHNLVLEFRESKVALVDHHKIAD